MAWHEPGNQQDSNNNRQQNPWNQGNGQRGNQADGPPDIDELARKLQEKMGGLFGKGKKNGGNGGGGKNAGGSLGGPLALGLLLLIGWLAYDMTHIVQPGQQGVVLRFGKYAETINPGLNIQLPRPIEKVYRVDVKKIRSGSYSGTMLTKDENIVDLNLAVQYIISDARNYLFNVQRPELSLRQATASAIREVVGKNGMDFVIQGSRAEVSTTTRTLLQEIIDMYKLGVNVTTVTLDRAQAPAQVQDAFEDAIKAREDQERLTNEAQAYANDVIPRARGAAARVLEEANAYRSSAIAQATGEAERFSKLLVEYAKNPELQRQRLYLESIENVYRNTNKVIVDVEGDSNPLIYLPLDKLVQQNGQGSNTAPRTTTQQQQQRDSQARSTNNRSNRTRSRERNGGLR